MSRAVLLTGGPTHPFAETAPLLVELLAGAGFATTEVREPSDSVDAVRGGAVDLLVVHALRWRMEQERYAALRAGYATELGDDDLAALAAFVHAGGGLLCLHTAVICFDAHPTWHALCGASWSWDRSTHPPLGSVDVAVTEAGRAHALTRGIDGFTVEDEVYGFLDEADDLDPLLVASHGGRTHPLLWARRHGDGRVVTDLLGHGPASFRHPDHAAILARAATWLTGGPG